MAKQFSHILSRRTVEVIDRQHLESQLQSKRKLRVKLGIDPNRPDLHLGHAVPLWKLREFQDVGHTAVLIIGDWTARIGDPSGKDKTRQPVSEVAVKANAKLFLNQAFLILKKAQTEVRFQSEWFSKLRLQEIMHLTSLVPVGELLSHETFRKRLREHLPFALHEALYPLLQGYDSVAIKADVELGGADQKFNVLMGRTIQKSFGQPPQDVLLVSYLIGLDGKEKMSKSLNNYIALRDSAEEMFGKIMSIPDHLIMQYFELCTSLEQDILDDIKRQLGSGANPRAIKARLASEIVTLYHGKKSAAAAAQNFEKKFGKRKNAGDIIPDVTLKKSAGKYSLRELLVAGKLAVSQSEARRKIQEGAVEVDGHTHTDPNAIVEIKKHSLIRLGKRFLRIE